MCVGLRDLTWGWVVVERSARVYGTQLVHSQGEQVQVLSWTHEMS